MAKTQGSRASSSARSRKRKLPELVIDVDEPPQSGSAKREKESEEPLDADQRNEIYEAAKRADYKIRELQEQPMQALIQTADALGVNGASTLPRQELIFQILKLKVTGKGLGWGEGVLDILPDGFGFLRSPGHNYLAGPDDIYVSPSQIRRLGLVQGHELSGPVRPPKEGEKFFAMLHVETVNGRTIDSLRGQVRFDALTPVLPRQRMPLEHPAGSLDLRLLDLLAPIGRGQRCLLMAPPQSGRTRLMTQMAQAILANQQDCYVLMVLLDERPEEVTEAKRGTGPEHRREVVASTFEEPASHHVALTQIALEKAKRMVEAGEHVVLFLDSLTQLTRAYNQEVPHSGKILATGLDAAAVTEPKRFFASARNLEEGGSLTIIASVLTDTDSNLNDSICEEFAGKANCEIRLDRELASLHIYPAIDVDRTGTRREDSLLDPGMLKQLRELRASLPSGSPRERLQALVAMVEATPDNGTFLANR